jgi:hypothetical protein
MKAYGDRNYNRAFSVAQERDPKTGAILSENCADLTGEILAAGSFDVVNTKATGRTIPNEQYREFQNTYARQGYTVVPAAKRAKP